MARLPSLGNPVTALGQSSPSQYAMMSISESDNAKTRAKRKNAASSGGGSDDSCSAESLKAPRLRGAALRKCQHESVNVPSAPDERQPRDIARVRRSRSTSDDRHNLSG